MKKRKTDPDQLKIKQKKGTWLRFIKLFPKCHLPVLFLLVYIILDVSAVNIGVSETDYTAQLFAGDTSAALVTKLIGVILLNLFAGSLLVFVGAVTSARINRNMRNVLLDKVMRLPMSYFKNENPREAVYRIVQNAIVIDSTIMLFLIPVFTAGYTAFSVFQRVFTYDWRLSAIMLAFVPIQIFIAFIFGRLNFSVSERDADINAGLMEKLAEMVTNIPLAKAFAREKKEVERGSELTGRLYRLNIKSSWLDQFKNLSETVVSLIQSVILVIVGATLLQGEEITIRAWISFFMFSSVFNNAISDFMMYWNNIKIIQGGAARVAEIMDAPEEEKSGIACEMLQGDLELQHVRFGYEEEKPVLKDISCTFPDCGVTALLGVSGCGKTTLVNLLMRLYDPQEGTIAVGGNPVSEYALEEYRSHFAMVSQNGMLFSGTVKENVCYGNETVTDEEFENALKRVGAYEFVNAMPQGAMTQLEEYGNNLSGGQRQRLCVARALLSKAHYLILDEPSASMDAIATAELMKVFKELSKDHGIIIIAHTAAVLSLADRVIVIEDGTVSAEGKPEEAQKTNAFLKELAGRRTAE